MKCQLLFLILMSVLLIYASGEFMLPLAYLSANNTNDHFMLLKGENLRVLDQEEPPDEEQDENQRLLKWNSAQKRQDRPDRRRRYTNPNRTGAEELRERWRKHNQAINRQRSRVDPYEPKHGGRAYMRHRRNGKNWKKNVVWNPHWWNE